MAAVSRGPDEFRGGVYVSSAYDGYPVYGGGGGHGGIGVGERLVRSESGAPNRAFHINHVSNVCQRRGGRVGAKRVAAQPNGR